MEIYCVKCKKATPTHNVQIAKTKTGRYYAKGRCAVCHGMKSRFVSAKDGKGLLGKLFFPSTGKVPGLNKIPLLGKLFF